MQMDSRSFDFSQDRFGGNDRGKYRIRRGRTFGIEQRITNVKGRFFVALRMTGKGKKLNYAN
jgi:hypothetical protein